MTISSTARTAGPFLGSGVVVNYPFAFKVFTTADIKVVHTNALGVDDGVWVLGTNYGVTLNANQNANPGGYITPAAALPSGEKVTITSNVSALQGLSLATGGNWDPRSVEDALDKITIVAQQLSSTAAGVAPGVVSAVAALPASVAAGGGVSATLPTPQAGSAIVWNATGTGLANSTLAAPAVAPSTLTATASAVANVISGQTPTVSVAVTPAAFFPAGFDYTVPGTAWQTFVGGVEYLFIGTVTWTGPAPFTVAAGQIVFNSSNGLPPGTVLSPSAADSAKSPPLYVAADGTCRALSAKTITVLGLPPGYVVFRQ